VFCKNIIYECFLIEKYLLDAFDVGTDPSVETVVKLVLGGII